jgi:hypothetical protein
VADQIIQSQKTFNFVKQNGRLFYISDIGKHLRGSALGPDYSPVVTTIRGAAYE